MRENTNISDSAYLQRIIDSATCGATVNIPKRSYYLTEAVYVRNKNNLIIDGNGSTFVTKYNNSADYSFSSNAFTIEGCSNITLKNFFIDTDVPVNISAVVTEINAEEAAITVEVDDSFEISGREVLMAFNSIDDEGAPDSHLTYYSPHPDPNIITLIQNEIICFGTYGSAKNDYLGDNRFKVYFPNNDVLKNTKVGDKLCIRHTMYGPAVITLRNSVDTVIQNVTMYSVPGFGVLVLPRCTNLTLEGLKIVLPENSRSYMPCNCDGVHITGLTGELKMKNCVFDGMGDDALNIHSTAGTVAEVNDNVISVNYRKKSRDGVLSPNWCKPGDLIKFYDTESLNVVATAHVASYNGTKVELENICGDIKADQMVQNTAFNASCHICDCIVRNSRARGFLFQTENVEVERCEFFGISHNAIKVAPAFVRWYEVGPCKNLYVHNNSFIKCGYVVRNFASVAVQTNHDGNDESIVNLHKNINIFANRFERTNGRCVEISSSDDISVYDNTFDSSCDKKNAIVFSACKNIKAVNNG